jgi:hypothetical protein
MKKENLKMIEQKFCPKCFSGNFKIVGEGSNKYSKKWKCEDCDFEFDGIPPTRTFPIELPTDEEIEDFAKRLRRLPKKKIDEVFYRCGWRAGGDEGGLKTFEWRTLDYIKKSDGNAERWVCNLLFDYPKDELAIKMKDLLIKHLEDVEKEEGIAIKPKMKKSNNYTTSLFLLHRLP